MSAVIQFPAVKRGAELVREIAIRNGYSVITQAQLVRTFRPDDNRPLHVQASQHVPRPWESCMDDDFGGAA